MTGTSATTAAAAAAAAISGRQRRDTSDLLAERQQPRNDRHGPPSGGPRVNGVKTDMVNERLIAGAPVRETVIPGRAEGASPESIFTVVQIKNRGARTARSVVMDSGTRRYRGSAGMTD
jgi:hypothetical protein